MTPLEYWRSGEGLAHITPPGCPKPEGIDFAAELRHASGPGLVCEFGCGVGRLAPLFEPRWYVGLDVCPAAIARARAACPDHQFAVIGDDGLLWVAEATFAHTVMLHVPDEALDATIARFASPRIVVSEIMGRRWRRDGLPPVFNREAVEYVAVFAAHGFRLLDTRSVPYPRYRETDLTILVFERGRS